jgi:hypothetical protein
MKTALAVLVTGLFIYLGYRLMGRIDLWLQGDAFVPILPDDLARTVVLYLDSPFDFQPGTLALDEGIHLTPLYDISVETVFPTASLLAFSGNDLENLLLIQRTKQAQPDCFVAARCNDRLYETLYKDMGAAQIFSGSFTLKEAFRQLKGRL